MSDRSEKVRLIKAALGTEDRPGWWLAQQDDASVDRVYAAVFGDGALRVANGEVGSGPPRVKTAADAAAEQLERLLREAYASANG